MTGEKFTSAESSYVKIPFSSLRRHLGPQALLCPNAENPNSGCTSECNNYITRRTETPSNSTMSQRRLATFAASLRHSGNPVYPGSMIDRHRRVAEAIKRVSNCI